MSSFIKKTGKQYLRLRVTSPRVGQTLDIDLLYIITKCSLSRCQKIVSLSGPGMLAMASCSTSGSTLSSLTSRGRAAWPTTPPWRGPLPSGALWGPLWWPRCRAGPQSLLQRGWPDQLTTAETTWARTRRCPTPGCWPTPSATPRTPKARAAQKIR